ncbi:hypothetical protein TNIN_335901 [Trichonephila inaurata madagascariensis]|uniref:Uncharacterized protein n=1 Tax=Trichonephila inaurata madagascariensis TaxID=2747483 RepID=A0A8X6WN11_9ARAC|nr:hypothetical protein TNIN_335901 [Trichonephila inaurata madagascariensis]
MGYRWAVHVLILIRPSPSGPSERMSLVTVSYHGYRTYPLRLLLMTIQIQEWEHWYQTLIIWENVAELNESKFTYIDKDTSLKSHKAIDTFVQ